MHAPIKRQLCHYRHCICTKQHVWNSRWALPEGCAQLRWQPPNQCEKTTVNRSADVRAHSFIARRPADLSPRAEPALILSLSKGMGVSEAGKRVPRKDVCRSGWAFAHETAPRNLGAVRVRCAVCHACRAAGMSYVSPCWIASRVTTGICSSSHRAICSSSCRIPWQASAISGCPRSFAATMSDRYDAISMCSVA